MGTSAVRRSWPGSLCARAAAATPWGHAAGVLDDGCKFQEAQDLSPQPRGSALPLPLPLPPERSAVCARPRGDGPWRGLGGPLASSPGCPPGAARPPSGAPGQDAWAGRQRSHPPAGPGAEGLLGGPERSSWLSWTPPCSADLLLAVPRPLTRRPSHGEMQEPTRETRRDPQSAGGSGGALPHPMAPLPCSDGDVRPGEQRAGPRLQGERRAGTNAGSQTHRPSRGHTFWCPAERSPPASPGSRLGCASPAPLLADLLFSSFFF